MDCRRRLVLAARQGSRAAAGAHRDQGRLEERGRVGRDVHDTVAQGQPASTMLVRAAEPALGRGEHAVVRERLAATYHVAMLSAGQAQDLTGTEWRTRSSPTAASRRPRGPSSSCPGAPWTPGPT